MSYFRYFPDEFYQFGNEQTTEIFPNISVYADIVDEIKDNVAFYQDYFIQENTRPDQVSFELYGTPNYHWTFYLMNNKLRERGWPLSNAEVLNKVQKDRDEIVITTRDPLATQMLVGQTLNGSNSGAVGVVDHRHIDLGQITVNMTSGSFVAGENITSTNANNDLQIISAVSVSPEYLSAHHYENSAGQIIDIDPTVGPGASLTEVTHLDRYIEDNESLKSIRVIKPTVVRDVVRSFREAIAS